MSTYTSNITSVLFQYPLYTLPKPPRNPHPPYSGRVPADVETDIRKLMSTYASNITSVLYQFPHHSRPLRSTLKPPPKPHPNPPYSGRVPADVETDIRKLMSTYASNITSLLCQFPHHTITHLSPNLRPILIPLIQDEYLRM